MAAQVRGNDPSTPSASRGAPTGLRGLRLPLAVIVLVGIVVACGPEADVATTTAGIDPHLRAVRLETSGCSPASGRTGSGIAIGSGLLVTAAHLIVRAETITVSAEGHEPSEAVVAAVDLQRDLAVLRWAPADIPDIEVNSASSGEQGLIVGAASSGTVPYEVRRYVDLSIEEILGTTRHSRLGYELSARTADGDSGAGAYDETNRLIGMVFATGPDEETTWITASSEIIDFAATVDPTDDYALCP